LIKNVIIGAIPAILIFAGFIGLQIGPILFLAIIGGSFYLLYAKKQGSFSGINTDSKKKNRVVSNVNVTFDDIGGLERVKRELKEALDFLIEQDAYKQYGIRSIKGILMDGPPGTGKTLLAKAAASYTDSVFLTASGSEFIEMYVGVGAQRVRELFQEARNLAKKNNKSNAIIFIDEIDVIGGKRDNSNQREYDQTLNQLLTEMDGMEENQSPKILVMAATNRKDMLDSALTRPGRFDRHITVDLPDKNARTKILDIHIKDKPISEDVNIEQLSKETYGLSGAQIESMINEAAIYALREKAPFIDNKHFSNAIDKVLMGEQKDREATKDEKRRVAIHELGHAIVAEVIKPGVVSQVALRPRGQALGYVRHNPLEEQYLHTKESIEQQIMIALGGTVAEEIFYGHRSTGAKNDFEQALNLVKHLIETGLSSLGIVNTNYVSKEKLESENNKVIDLLLDKTTKLLYNYKKVISDGLVHLEKEEVLTGQEFRVMIKILSNENK